MTDHRSPGSCHPAMDEPLAGPRPSRQLAPAEVLPGDSWFVATERRRVTSVRIEPDGGVRIRYDVIRNRSGKTTSDTAWFPSGGGQLLVELAAGRRTLASVTPPA